MRDLGSPSTMRRSEGTGLSIVLPGPVSYVVVDGQGVVNCTNTDRPRSNPISDGEAEEVLRVGLVVVGVPKCCDGGVPDPRPVEVTVKYEPV